VYTVDKDTKSTNAMKMVYCKDEDKELQSILKNNFNLLPGDQIDPEVPCKWMLVRREMPVPDPVTGIDRWNIDFFFVDQNATPTFVECKRYLDTRSRREVVGQVLEYAANGRHYWSAADMRTHADATAREEYNTTVEDAFRSLQSVIADSTEAFFKEVERRLKTGEVRIVFFLEQAPVELKRLVEFLNTQMSSVEVLIVEARQYEGNGIRVVVPMVFGFTEQIRDIKRAIATERDGKAVAVDWESFKASVEQKDLGEQSIAAIQKLYNKCKSLQADISWGRGTITGSFSPKWPTISSKVAPFSVYTNGKLELHFSSFQNSETAKAFSTFFASGISKGGLSFPDDHMTTWFNYEAEKWVPVVDNIIEGLEGALCEYNSKEAVEKIGENNSYEK
jgi:hypothetical protein